MKPILEPPGRELLLDFARSNVLLAFDFDGTLAPIVDDPEAAVMASATRRLLIAVCRRYPTVIISGRAQADVAVRMGNVPVRDIVGNHGLEPTASPAIYQQVVRRWVPYLQRFVEAHAGTELENKGFSVAVHYRRSREKKRVLADLQTLIGSLGPLRVVGGKEVVNLLPADAPHKGLALERLRSRFRTDTTIYVGDDQTDEDVFLMEKSLRLLGIRVERSRRSAAPFYLQSQSDIDSLLRVLEEARSGASAGAA